MGFGIFLVYFFAGVFCLGFFFSQRYVALVLIPVVLIRAVDSTPDSDIADDQVQGGDSSSFLSSFLRVRWSVVRGSVDEDADEHVGVGAKSKSKSTGEDERGRGRGRGR